MDARAQFALNLRTLRLRKGLSQMDLGNEAGLHFSEISLLERGGRDPRLTTIIKLARGLGVPARRLLENIS